MYVCMYIVYIYIRVCVYAEIQPIGQNTRQTQEGDIYPVNRHDRPKRFAKPIQVSRYSSVHPVYIWTSVKRSSDVLTYECIFENTLTSFTKKKLLQLFDPQSRTNINVIT